MFFFSAREKERIGISHKMACLGGYVCVYGAPRRNEERREREGKENRDFPRTSLLTPGLFVDGTPSMAD
jgi:hypothetical protein